MAEDCRVRKLHIRTPDKTHVPHMMFVLEDALRTASYSGIPANGMIYVRRLDLGKLNLSVSSRVVARKIDELLRYARPVVITESSPEQPAATIVWFPDELSPYRILLKLLAENHQPLSWYWPAAVKGWNSKLSVRQSYHLILSQVSEKEAGIRGMFFVLEPLFNTGTLHDVINSLDRKEASHMLINMGLKPAHDFTVVPMSEAENHGYQTSYEANVPITFLMRNAINKAIRMWSVFDPRTMLLSYLVLIGMGEKTNPFQVNRLLETVADSQSISIENQNMASTAGIEVDAGIEETVLFPKRKSGDIVDEAKDIPAFSGVNPQLTATSQKEMTSLIHPQLKEDQSQDGPVLRLPLSEKRIGDGRKEPEGKPALAFREHTLTESWPLLGSLAGELSGYTGLIFLIPLLKRLGMENLLEKYPEYEDLNLAERIIFRCTELLNIPFEDPVLRFLGEKPQDSDQSVEFTAPLEWRRILFPLSSDITYQFRIARIKGTPGRRLLLDEKGWLILGVWNSKNRALIAPWFDMSRKPFQYAAPQSWSLNHLVNNIILAMSRYLRRYADMSLSALIRRPAYIATTRTHLDVSIPFNRLDIRVRMAGLDINPGWVPWLGKVIQFHYIGED